MELIKMPQGIVTGSDVPTIVMGLVRQANAALSELQMRLAALEDLADKLGANDDKKSADDGKKK